MTAIIRLVGGLLAGLITFQLTAATPWLPPLAVRIAIAAVAALSGWLVAPLLWRVFVRAMDWVLQGLASLSLKDLALGAGGLIVGLVIAFLLGFLVSGIPYVGQYLRLGLALVFGYLGIHVALQRRDEVSSFLPPGILPREGGGAGATPKVLDTSVIIDGRIADLCKTGFIEGPLLVPRSVLNELQRIADSPDPVRRARGRRGLDMLNALQKDFETVHVVEEDDGGTGDVDGRLVAYAKAIQGWIVTNDFNLNKVAELQGVRVLNINELAQALRPVMLPGESLSILIIKDGKEPGQGVGYLEDGTMVVVEGGKKLIGEAVDAVVTSVLQTVAGRMIFARPRAEMPVGSTISHRR